MKRFLLMPSLLVLFHCSQQTSEPINESNNEQNKQLIQSSNHPLPAIPSLIHDQSYEAVVEQQFEQRFNYINLVKKQHPNGEKLAWAIGQLGKTFHAYQMNQQAIDSYLNAIANDPEDHEWHYLLAHVYKHEGNFDAAIDHFTAAIKLNNHLPARVWLIDVLIQDNKIQQAEKTNQRLLAEHPKHPMALYHMALLKKQLQQFDKAEQHLVDILQQQPRAFQVHYQLGQLYARSGQHDLAQDHLSQVPDDADLKVSITFDDPLMQKVANLRKGTQTLIKQAKKASKQGHHKRALSLLKTAKEADPDRIDIDYNTAVVYLKMRRRTEAKTILESLKQHNDHTALALLATINNAEKDHKQAISHLLQAIEIQPDEMTYRIQLGDTYHRQKQYELAIQQYNLAINHGQGHSLTSLKMIRSLFQTNIDRLELTTRIEQMALPVKLHATQASMLARLRATQINNCQNTELTLDDIMKKSIMEQETQAICAAWEEDFDRAIAIQQGALTKTQQVDIRQRLQTRLALYKNHTKPQQLWLTDEPL